MTTDTTSMPDSADTPDTPDTPAAPDTSAATEDRPAFTGLAIYRDLRLRFSALVPDGWAREALPKERGGGVVYVPDPADPDTTLAIQGRRLPSSVKRVEARDMEALQSGFVDGIALLPEAHIEEGTQKAQFTRDLLDLEARHTYRDVASGQVRKRWVRVLYRGNVQISVIAQGSTPAAFSKWEAMFNSAFRSVQFADWWAEVTGHQWLRRLDKPPEDVVLPEGDGAATSSAAEAKAPALKRRRKPN